MFHKVGNSDLQIQGLENRLLKLEQKLYLNKDSIEIIAIQIEKNQTLDEWKNLVFFKKSKNS